MVTRDPLEVLGETGLGNHTSLRAEGSSVVYTKGDQVTAIPIGSIKKVSLFQSGLLRGNGSLVITVSEGFLARAPLQLYFRDVAEFEYAQNIHNYIIAFQANTGTSNSASASHFSVADELIKLKALLDDGALTQEEFDRKKSKLLGE